MARYELSCIQYEFYSRLMGGSTTLPIGTVKPLAVRAAHAIEMEAARIISLPEIYIAWCSRQYERSASPKERIYLHPFLVEMSKIPDDPDEREEQRRPKTFS